MRRLIMSLQNAQYVANHRFKNRLRTVDDDSLRAMYSAALKDLNECAPRCREEEIASCCLEIKAISKEMRARQLNLPYDTALNTLEL